MDRREPDQLRRRDFEESVNDSPLAGGALFSAHVGSVLYTLSSLTGSLSMVSKQILKELIMFRLTVSAAVSYPGGSAEVRISAV